MSTKTLMSPAICCNNDLGRAIIDSPLTPFLRIDISLFLEVALVTVYAKHLILHNLLCSAVFFSSAALLSSGVSTSQTTFSSDFSA